MCIFPFAAANVTYNTAPGMVATPPLISASDFWDIQAGPNQLIHLYIPGNVKIEDCNQLKDLDDVDVDTMVSTSFLSAYTFIFVYTLIS